MLPNVNDQRILHALDRESRLVLALSACIILALDRKLIAKEAVDNACKVFSEVFPEKAGEHAKKPE